MMSKQVLKRNNWFLSATLWTIMTLGFGLIGGCKDDPAEAQEGLPFDPAKAVVVTDFLPKEGGMGQRLVIYGENFGTDPKEVKVHIGGKEALVINALGTSIYCLVPKQAFGGEIEV